MGENFNIFWVGRQANFWDDNKAKYNFIHKHKPGISPPLCQVTPPRVLSILVTLEVLWKSDMTPTGSPALNTLYLVNVSSVRVPNTSSIVATLNVKITLNVKKITDPSSHSPQYPCNQKDTHLKICKYTSLYRQQTNSHTKRRGHKNQYTNSIVNKYYISNIY